LWIVEVSRGAVITCSSESVYKAVSKSIRKSKPRLIVTLNRDSSKAPKLGWSVWI
jgi:hypothetical protein